MEVASDLIDFLSASPTAFHVVAKRRLKIAVYKQLSERDDWELKAGKKFYFTRNFSTIVSFAIGKKYVTDSISAVIHGWFSGISPMWPGEAHSLKVEKVFLTVCVRHYSSSRMIHRRLIRINLQTR